MPVEPTRSQNITVRCRRSAASVAAATGGRAAVAGSGAGVIGGGAGGAAAALPNSAIAASIFRRCPSETPSSLRS